MLKNATATIIDDDENSIPSLSCYQAAHVMLKSEIAKQGNNTAVPGSNAQCCRNVAIDSAGTAISKENQGFFIAAGMTIKGPNRQGVADKNRTIFGKRAY